MLYDSFVFTRNGCLSASYEDNYTVPPIIDAADFWRFAHSMTMSHNTAKSNKQPLRQLRLYSKMFSTPGGEAAFKDMEKNTKISNEMSVSVHGDLGKILLISTILPDHPFWILYDYSFP